MKTCGDIRNDPQRSFQLWRLSGVLDKKIKVQGSKET